MWTARAVKVHPVDEQRSLECVRRLNLAKRDVLDLVREEEEAARLETELAADLDRVESRLASLRRRRNSLAVRDARAEALATVEGSMPGTMVAEVDGIFERWETQVTRTEIRAGLDDPAGDRIAAAFDREEDDEALRKQLAALIHPEA
jgi:phage shock protein A